MEVLSGRDVLKTLRLLPLVDAGGRKRYRLHRPF
jgi:hypothetical protein